MAGGMREPEAVTPVQSTSPHGAGASGDEFVCAFNEWRAELVSTLYYYLGNYDDALDAAQDAFVKCWRRQDEIGKVRNMKAWIFRVGLNAAKDLQRNAWRRRARPLSDSIAMAESKGVSPEQALIDREARERLRRALLDLRPEEKEVFLLRQNAALTYEEIAELRKSPVGTVKTQMRAALQKLKLVLREEVIE
jgi:RNA polymerase sigma-70 factor (ECF subfamily)